ncbi:MAG: hypothetical protein NTY02_05615 [Acidobacteria bacterium]|nr:hypothetical protein [Acidobacteriota bacterium]
MLAGRALVFSVFPNQKTLPFSVLVPDFSVTDETAPAARPYSAS